MLTHKSYAKDLALFRLYAVLVNLELALPFSDDVWGNSISYDDFDHFAMWASLVEYEPK